VVEVIPKEQAAMASPARCPARPVLRRSSRGGRGDVGHDVQRLCQVIGLFGWAEIGWNQPLGWIHPSGWAHSSRSVRCEAGVPYT
jgi:hypothetical protein